MEGKLWVWFSTYNEYVWKTLFHLKGSSQMSHSLVTNLFKWPKTEHSIIPAIVFSGVSCYLLFYILLSRACWNLLVVPNPPPILPVTEFEKNATASKTSGFSHSSVAFLYFGCSSAWLVVQRRKYHVTGLCKGPNTNYYEPNWLVTVQSNSNLEAQGTETRGTILVWKENESVISLIWIHRVCLLYW